MRGTVIPTLEDVFGVGVQKVLLGLANQSNECRDMVEEDTVGAVLSTASFSQGGTHFSLSSYRSRSSFFYRTVLQSVLHNTGLPMISLKAIGTLMKHLSLEDIGDRWLQLKPDYGTFLRADGRIFVFKSSAFVWGKRQGKWREDNEGFRIGVGGEGRVGEWILSTEVVHGSVGDGCGVEDAKEMVKRKPFGDFEDLLEGRFEYCVIVKTKKRASVDGSGVVPIIATRGSSASLSPPRKYSGMNGSPLSLSSRSSEEDLKREEDFFPRWVVWRGAKRRVEVASYVRRRYDRSSLQLTPPSPPQSPSLPPHLQAPRVPRGSCKDPLLPPHRRRFESGGIGHRRVGRG